MTQLKKYSLAGKELGSVSVDSNLADAKANSQMVKDYIVAIRANARQWSANTKTRAEVAHTTKKPRPQKGTGNARIGNLVIPQFRGGGIVFGPKPKFDQHVKINRKERKAAIRSLIAEKMRNGNLVIIQDTKMEKPCTKEVARFLTALSLNKRVLFLGEGNFEEVEVAGKKQKVSVKNDQHEAFMLSTRNLPKVEFALVQNINGYEVAVAQTVVMTESALKEMNEWLQ